jgi:hypothetical protein
LYVVSALAFHVQISVRTFSMRLEPSPHVKRAKVNAESRGFSPGTPVSSHRESSQGGLGKRAHSNCICCCGDPVQVGKAK